MRWQFWQHKGSQQIPPRIRKALMSQYQLTNDDLINLRVVEKPGRILSGRRVQNIRVLDTKALGSAARDITYDGMDGHPEGVLFEGHVDPQGYVYLVDKRPYRNRANPQATTPTDTPSTPA